MSNRISILSKHSSKDRLQAYALLLLGVIFLILAWLLHPSTRDYPVGVLLLGLGMLLAAVINPFRLVSASFLVTFLGIAVFLAFKHLIPGNQNSLFLHPRHRTCASWHRIDGPARLCESWSRDTRFTGNHCGHSRVPPGSRAYTPHFYSLYAFALAARFWPASSWIGLPISHIPQNKGLMPCRSARSAEQCSESSCALCCLSQQMVQFT